jgi:hypothetical protein
MLSTINGFDLLLVLVIIGLVFKAMRLNDECNSYVRQIVEVSQQNVLLTRELVEWEAKYEYDLDLAEPGFKPASDDYKCTCDFCSDLDPWLSECKAFDQAPPF